MLFWLLTMWIAIAATCMRGGVRNVAKSIDELRLVDDVARVADDATEVGSSWTFLKNLAKESPEVDNILPLLKSLDETPKSAEDIVLAQQLREAMDQSLQAARSGGKIEVNWQKVFQIWCLKLITKKYFSGRRIYPGVAGGCRQLPAEGQFPH